MRLLALLSLPLFMCAAFAAEPPSEVKTDPRVFLQGAIDEVLAIVYDGQTTGGQPLADRVRPVLEKYFNFESITRRAIGPGWRQFTPDQQKRVTVLFTDLVIRTYADRFDAGERPGITYGAPAELAPGKRELPTTIDYAGKKYAVAYRLEQVAGAWRIYDVIIEGVSMIANYRTQFDGIVQHGGADAVIHSLEQNLTQPIVKK